MKTANANILCAFLQRIPRDAEGNHNKWNKNTVCPLIGFKIDIVTNKEIPHKQCILYQRVCFS